MSLSARRAWIEKQYDIYKCLWRCVALRKESVDRKVRSYFLGSRVPVSLSARRAWIEKVCFVAFCLGAKVALRKESVDRKTCC